MKKFALFAFTIIWGATMAEAKEWRGIVPLHSTRADVERVLGEPATSSLVAKCRCFYDLGDETVTILYANGLGCAEPEERDGRVGGWNLPRDTVIEIDLYFKSGRSLSDLKIDQAKFRQITNPELPGIVYYIDTEAGVKMEVGGDEVRSTTYFGEAKEGHFRCPKNPSPAPQKRSESVCPIGPMASSSRSSPL